MFHYTLTNRPCSLQANLWSEAFEVLSGEAEYVHRQLLHSLSPQHNWKLLYHGTYLSLQSLFSLSLKKEEQKERKK